MTNINLLPWREKLRKERRKRFYSFMLASLLSGVFVLWQWHNLIDIKIDRQRIRNNFLNQEIAQLDKKLVEIKQLQQTRQNLLERMQIIQQLQGNRPIIVHIFDELVRLLPQGVNFSKITRKSHRLTLEGTAETNKQISDLMRSLADAAWFINPTLDRIAKATHTDLLVKKFKLSVSQNTVKPQAKKVN